MVFCFSAGDGGEREVEAPNAASGGARRLVSPGNLGVYVNLDRGLSMSWNGDGDTNGSGSSDCSGEGGGGDGGCGLS